MKKINLEEVRKLVDQIASSPNEAASKAHLSKLESLASQAQSFYPPYKQNSLSMLIYYAKLALARFNCKRRRGECVVFMKNALRDIESEASRK